MRAELAERLQVLDGQRVAGQVQQRVQQHRAVAVGDHEAVAVGPLRIAGVVAQVVAPQHFGDVGHAHRHAGVAGVGFLDRVHREGADRIGKLPAARCLHREAIPFCADGSGWKGRAFWTKGPGRAMQGCAGPVTGARDSGLRVAVDAVRVHFAVRRSANNPTVRPRGRAIRKTLVTFLTPRCALLDCQAHYVVTMLNASMQSVRLIQFTDMHLFGDAAGRLRGVATLPALQAAIADAQRRCTARTACC